MGGCGYKLVRYERTACRVYSGPRCDEGAGVGPGPEAGSRLATSGSGRPAAAESGIAAGGGLLEVAACRCRETHRAVERGAGPIPGTDPRPARQTLWPQVGEVC